MAHFCGHCGAQHDGTGGFCGHCGQPLHMTPPPQQPYQHPNQPPPANPPAAPPPYQPPAQQQPPYPPQGYPQQPPAAPGHYPPQQGYHPPQPVVPRVNPFIGWPVGDFVRDGAALFALFATLGMPWHIEAEYKGGEQWWVVISVLLSVLSLAVPYVAKSRLVPAWTPTHFRLLKLGLNVPLLASVLAALINELVNVGEPDEGGLGVGIAMGLAGCGLALQPRRADEDPAPADDRLWNDAARFTALAAPVVGVLAFLAYVVDDVAGDAVLFDEVLGFFALALLTVVMMLVVVGWPAVGMFGGSPAWRRVFATVAFTVLGIGLFSLASDGDGLFTWPPYEKWKGAIGIGGTFVLGAAAGLSVSRAQERRTSGVLAPVDGWLRTARSALMVSASASGVAALALLVGIVNNEEVEASAVVALLTVVAAGAAAGAALTLVSQPGRHRVTVLALLTAEVVVGFIAMGIINGEEVALGPVRLPDVQLFGAAVLVFPITGYVVAAWLCLPALAAYSLTVPREVRGALGPLVQPTQPAGYPGQHQHGHPQQGFPQQPYPPQQPPQQPPPGYPPAQQPPPGYPPPPPPQGWPPHQ